jgi:DNA-binding transcriptional LysR family regulator
MSYKPAKPLVVGATVDLANLNAFIAIAETGSFSEAAERLHLTQPAVSKRIAGLELQLDVRLFDRLGREVNLTEAGRALLPRAYQILGVLDDTRRALTNLNGEVSGRLTLATSHHIGLHRLPPLLRAFTRSYPQVALDIQFLDSEVAYEEILHGRAELAVITLAPESREPVHAAAVWDDPLDFVAAPEHPLARNGAVTLADVARHPAVFPGGNTFTHHIVNNLFAAQGLTPNIGMSTNYLETIKMMVSIGLAWSVLPRTMLDEQVVRLPLPGIQLQRRLGYILHKERTLSNAAKAFMALLDEQRRLP